MPDELVPRPMPVRVEKLEGSRQVTYGPGVVIQNPTMAAALGGTVASMAEAERNLEAILKAVVGGNSRALAVLLASFRGHKQLLGTVQAVLDEAGGGTSENAQTFAAIKPLIFEAWEIRDQLAHGIWAKCDLYPGAALRLSARKLGRMEENLKEALRQGDFERANNTLDVIDAEAWYESDFVAAQGRSDAVVNSLMAFSACISQSPEEAAWLHSLLRSQGLLNAPPWMLRNPTRPPETAGKP